MYIPDRFRETRAEVLRSFIAAHPLAALIASAPGDGLVANYIPMMFAPRDGQPHGALVGHIARANTLWQVLPPGADVLVLFGGANHYITPAWYPDKAQHGKVVPTWNYSVVQARGSIHFDTSDTHALENVTALTDHQESARDAPWKVTDAPSDYIAQMVRHTVAFEIELTELVGKFKASQHRPEAERDAVANGLQALGVSADSRAEMVRGRGG
jgi:transcriptional regulator